MSSDALSTGAPRKTPIWKRLILIGGSFGAALVVAGGLLALFTHWYYSYPRPVRKWPEREIYGYGMKASLKTRWRNDTLYYELRISPAAPDAVGPFDSAFRSGHEPFGLTLFLYDDSGFQLCSASSEALDITRDIGKNGKIASLSVDSTWPFCSYGRYKDSSKWGLAWKGLPKLSTNPAPPLPNPARATNGEATKPVDLGPITGRDTISGVDPLTGRIDTVSGRSFLVYRSGEQYTVISWSAKEVLRFSCKTQSSCLVTNTDRSETVHARLSK